MSHIKEIIDTETHFIINPDTRSITTSFAGNNILVQHDHNSERFTFEMPRYVEGHDMLECTDLRIHYSNADQTKWQKADGVYIPDDLSISEDDENTLIFSWLLSSATTQYVGNLNFSVEFLCLDGEEIEYAWNTGAYKDVTVIESIHSGESVMTDNVDVLIAFKNEIIRTVAASVNNFIQPRTDYVTITANAWVGVSSPYSQVVRIKDVTEYSQVDLTPSVEQLNIFHEKDLAFVTENDGGVVTVYAVGQKPMNDYTIQVTITEVAI